MAFFLFYFCVKLNGTHCTEKLESGVPESMKKTVWRGESTPMRGTFRETVYSAAPPTQASKRMVSLVQYITVQKKHRAASPTNQQENGIISTVQYSTEKHRTVQRGTVHYRATWVHEHG